MFINIYPNAKLCVIWRSEKMGGDDRLKIWKKQWMLVYLNVFHSSWRWWRCGWFMLLLASIRRILPHSRFQFFRMLIANILKIGRRWTQIAIDNFTPLLTLNYFKITIREFKWLTMRCQFKSNKTVKSIMQSEWDQMWICVQFEFLHHTKNWQIFRLDLLLFNLQIHCAVVKKLYALLWIWRKYALLRIWRKLPDKKTISHERPVSGRHWWTFHHLMIFLLIHRGNTQWSWIELLFNYIKLKKLTVPWILWIAAHGIVNYWFRSIWSLSPVECIWTVPHNVSTEDNNQRFVEHLWNINFQLMNIRKINKPSCKLKSWICWPFIFGICEGSTIK